MLFLCSDIRDIWPAYLDVRTHEVSIAAAFCASEQLLVSICIAVKLFLTDIECQWQRLKGYILFLLNLFIIIAIID